MKKIIALITTILIVIPLASCGIVEEIAKVMPSSENTYTNIADVNAAMQEVMQRGEETFDFNIADVTEDDLAHIADNMSTFWGEPKEYLITSLFQDIKDIIPDRLVDVMSVTNTFRLSNNYYVHEYIRNGVAIPEEQTAAIEIAKALQGIRTELFEGSDGTEFGDALAVHDWLVANLEYDEYVPELSDKNGSYGALVDRRTMCQGYAEAFELILRCYTDITITQIVGDAQNVNNSGEISDWVGHAWNAVMLDGQWVHIDATFDDPKGNPSGQVSHYYFAQNDTVMTANHRWAAGYFPVCDGEDFLYYKTYGMFTVDSEAFEALVTNLLSDANPVQIEIASVDTVLDEESIQFVFKANSNIEEIYWSNQTHGNISVIIIEPGYINEGAE